MNIQTNANETSDTKEHSSKLLERERIEESPFVWVKSEAYTGILIGKYKVKECESVDEATEWLRGDGFWQAVAVITQTVIEYDKETIIKTNL